jgi:hypothetical protein
MSCGPKGYRQVVKRKEQHLHVDTAHWEDNICKELSFPKKPPPVPQPTPPNKPPPNNTTRSRKKNNKLSFLPPNKPQPHFFSTVPDIWEPPFNLPNVFLSFAYFRICGSLNTCYKNHRRKEISYNKI